MAKPFMNGEDSLPAGLMLERAHGVFWWTRDGQKKKKKTYAVCIQKLRDKIEISALPVVGFLDRRQKSPCLRMRAMSWLVRSETDARVFRTIFEYAKDSTLGSTCDAHWFAIKADTPDEAKSHPDVRFVLAHIAHYQMTHAFKGIYFISNGQGAIKIGRTGSSLASRVAACQTGSPHELYVVAAIEDGDFAKTERKLHRKYESLHIRGEWFSMDDATAIAIAKSMGGREWTADTLEGVAVWCSP